MLPTSKIVTEKSPDLQHSMNFMEDLHVFWGVPVRKKTEILGTRAGFIAFPGLSGTLLLYALVLIGRNDGDDNSAADAVQRTRQISRVYSVNSVWQRGIHCTWSDTRRKGILSEK